MVGKEGFYVQIQRQIARIGTRLLKGPGLGLLFFFLMFSLSEISPALTAEPLVVSRNPHYFQDAKGNVLILSGSQTWNTLQDWGSDGSLQALDFDAFVKFLRAHGHNFTLLWTTEMPEFCGFPALANSPPNLTVSPLPWLRT